MSLIFYFNFIIVSYFYAISGPDLCNILKICSLFTQIDILRFTASTRSAIVLFCFGLYGCDLQFIDCSPVNGKSWSSVNN